MKTILIRRFTFWFCIISLIVAASAFAQLPITNVADGTDGVLIVGSNTNIDLSQAGNGSWTSASARPGFGTYDSTQWAVVFKYSSVIISNGATLTFSNHPTHAPVVWLVTSNVTINGTITLDGQPWNSDANSLPEPGPGGFRGGGGVYGQGPGFGPGGANDNGGYADYNAYGNPRIVPLIGGSGGQGDSYSQRNGNAGGGAILIAAAQTITINNTGYIHANGPSGGPASGSGGAIRLLANAIAGGGNLAATGVHPGRIRLEANSVSGSLTNTPVTVGTLPDSPPVIFPTNSPTIVAITSVAGKPINFDPKAAMSSSGNDDVTLVTTNQVTIQLQTMNFPTNGTVNVYIKPRYASQTVLPAVLDGGTTNLANWHVTTLLNYTPNQGHTVIQARAVY